MIKTVRCYSLKMLEIQLAQNFSISQKSDKRIQKLKIAMVYIQHSALWQSKLSARKEKIVETKKEIENHNIAKAPQILQLQVLLKFSAS